MVKKGWLVLAVLLELSGASGISTAAGGVLYVKPSVSGSGDCSDWPNACTLQTALGAASTDDEIWVAEGTHKPTTGTDRTATFQLKSGVAVYGGFAGTETSREQRDWALHETILSGDIGTVGDNSDNSYHVVTGSGTDATAILDGSTISGGNAEGGYFNPQARGGGMYNSSGNPTLTNVTFSGNSADHDGGGMFNDGGSSPTLVSVTFSGNLSSDNGGALSNLLSSPTLVNVTFSLNSGQDGGGMYNNRSSPTLVNVTFSRNSARTGGGIYNYRGSPTLTEVAFTGNSASERGGGMCNTYSSPTLTDVTFSGNSVSRRGGGMHNDYGSNPTLVNVTFTGNRAATGGGMFNRANSAPTLVNVTFSGNAAGYAGGVMYNRGSNPTLVNVTLSGNSAADYGGVMYNDQDSSPTLSNCILWGNTAGEGAQIYNNPGASATVSVSYSDIQGGYAGQHNIDADPEFVDADGPDDIVGTLDDNLRLRVSSPAINRGDNDALPADTLDLDGDGDTAEKLPLDLDGNARICCRTVDMGAYEVQIIDAKETYLPLLMTSDLP